MDPGADGGKTGCAIDRILDRLGDQLLDLLGGEAGRLGLDVHRRGHEIGKDVQRRVTRGPKSGE